MDSKHESKEGYNDRDNEGRREINHYLMHLEDIIDEFKHWKTGEEYLKVQIDLELFATLTPQVLSEHYPRLSEKAKKKVSERVNRIIKGDLEKPTWLDGLYKQWREDMFDDPAVQKAIEGLHVSLEKKTRPRFISENSSMVPLHILNVILRKSLVDQSLSFSFDSLVKELREFATYGKGGKATQATREKRYQIAKGIFEKFEAQGGVIPIKRTEIYGVFKTLWPTRLKQKLPKEDTLFDYQKTYQEEKKQKKG